MKVASFFAGIGGIDLGFERAGFNVIWANEIDEYATQTYIQNFSLNPVRLEKGENISAEGTFVVGDIHKLSEKDIPDFDVLVGGFPCQAFSVAGYRKGFNDERGNLFFELCRVIKEKKPAVVFLENVKNLVGHDNGNTFKVILGRLQELGYHVKYQVLNACQYGNLPQNRERIYIVGFRRKSAYEKFDFPHPVALTKTIADCVDFDTKKEERFYYTPEKCSFYSVLREQMLSDKTLYQWRRVYVRENKSNLCPTLTANMGTGGHNVPLVKTKNGIRKITPRECLNLMGFPPDYKLPETMALTHLYKQAGNSVVVPVIQAIAEKIYEAVLKSQRPSKKPPLQDHQIQAHLLL